MSASESLRAAINSIRANLCLDEHALLMLARLEKDEHGLVSEAFAEFEGDDASRQVIIYDCIQAEILSRTSQARFASEKDKSEKIAHALSSIENVMLLVAELEAEKPDSLDGRITFDAKSWSAVKGELQFLQDKLQARKRIADETPGRLGATRKIKNRGKAATTVAIGWLAEGIRGASGRPHLVAAAQLASVVLDREISPEQMREAEKTRRRDWRL